MNILYLVYAYDANTLQSGSGQRTIYLKRALDKIGTTYVFSPVFYKKDERTDRDARVVVRCLETRRSLLYVLNHFVIKWFKILRFKPRNVCSVIEQEFPGVKFDVVVARYTWVAAYCSPWKLAPVVIDVDDYPLEIFNTLCAPKWWVGASLGRKIVAYWQAGIFRKAKRLFIANPEQLAYLPAGKGRLLPNLPPPIEGGRCANRDVRDTIVTVATYAHPPNVAGVRHFLSTVWPEFHRRYPSIRYRIVGRDAPVEFSRIAGVEVVGFVDNLRDEYERAVFALVPIYSGSGTCIKALEALVYGRVALCSTFGARGLDARLLGRGLQVARTDDDLLNIACRLMADSPWRGEQEADAANSVAHIYSLKHFDIAVFEGVRL